MNRVLLLKGCFLWGGLLSLLPISALSQSSQFYLSNTQVFFSARERTSLLTLSNTGTTEINFELSVKKWMQDSTGNEVLSPSDGEIIIFPLILSIPPGEERNIRVGTRQPPGDVESTFRLFVAELPPANISSDGSTQLRLIKTLSLPVFIAPITPQISGEFTNTSIDRGQLGFTLKNTGNVHIQTLPIVVNGENSTGDILFEKKLDSIYILPGIERSFSQLPLPQAGCDQVRKVNIRLTYERNPFTTSIPTPNGVCR